MHPYLKLNYHTDTELYAYKNIDLKYFGTGFDINYITENISLKLDLSYNFYDVINQRPNDFNRISGFGTIENSPGLTNNQFNFFDAKVHFSYRNKKIEYYFGRSNPIWGTGICPIFISDKIPAIFNMGYKYTISKKLSYEHLYGTLNSRIEAEGSYYDFEGYSVYSEVPRNIAAHKIEYRPINSLVISINEIIVFGGNRKIEPYYMLPGLPFLPIQTFLGDIDNDMIGFSISNQLQNKLTLYSSILIDEWSPTYTFKKKDKNWAVYQLGINKKNFIRENDNLVFEYVYSDKRVFKHRFAINDYYSFDYPVGFWAGPHSDFLILKYSLGLGKINLNLSASKSRRGELHEIAIGKYSGLYIIQFQGIVEEKNIINIELSKDVNQRAIIEFGYNYINWKNAGFNPMIEDNQILKDLIKNDIYFNINYSFKEYSF